MSNHRVNLRLCLEGRTRMGTGSCETTATGCASSRGCGSLAGSGFDCASEGRSRQERDQPAGSRVEDSLIASFATASPQCRRG